MITIITFVALVALAASSAYLNVTGRTTVSECVWAAVDHTPMLIGVMALVGYFLVREIVREGMPGHELLAYSVGALVAHWGWRF